ncbi:MAG: bifunctional folylpolyglutamate synthase/dihydrofolate synthase [Anaerolineales bacterium]|nr:bifunctional folylpolyglutamate synthase/dihydrofolate synthase [Anaerolineales bacterium]
MDIELVYQETLNYIYSFVDRSLTRSFRYSPEKFDLGRMQEFVERLGRPHEAYPIIHVTGTKGKGSVSSMCASALRAAGYRVGLYTSPHLQDFAERIQLDGQPIAHQDVVELAQEIKTYLDEETQLTTFEFTTALAFLYYARKGAEAVVAEVGLGGRLDATNVITPVVSVITSISYDHTDILGETLSEIANEKAGIIKPTVPIVLAPQKDEARLVIERIAAERCAPLILVGRDYLFAPLSRKMEHQSLLLWSASEQPLIDEYIESGGIREWEPTRLTIPLLGYHQVENAATAYAALQVANSRGVPVSEGAIRSGFARTHWPGRFEVLNRNPDLVIDSAHNRDSALKLRLALDDYFPGQPVILIFGASEDKDVEGMFAELMPRVRRVLATQSYHPRAMEPERLVTIAHRYGKPARVIPAVEDALEEALRLAEGDTMVLATGSIFVAAGARHTWYNRLVAAKE